MCPGLVLSQDAVTSNGVYESVCLNVVEALGLKAKLAGDAIEGLCEVEVPYPACGQVPGRSACENDDCSISIRDRDLSGLPEISFPEVSVDSITEGLKGAGRCLCKTPGIGDAGRAVPRVDCGEATTPSICDNEFVDKIENGIDGFRNLLDTAASKCSCLESLDSLLANQGVKDTTAGLSQQVANAVKAYSEVFECLAEENIDSRRGDTIDGIQDERQDDVILWGAEILLEDWANLVAQIVLCTTTGSTCDGILEILIDVLKETVGNIQEQFLDKVVGYYVNMTNETITAAVDETIKNYEEAVTLVEEKIAECEKEVTEDIDTIVTKMNGWIQKFKETKTQIEDCFIDIRNFIKKMKEFLSKLEDFDDVSSLLKEDALDTLVSTIRYFSNGEDIREVYDCLRIIGEFASDIDSWIEDSKALFDNLKGLGDLEACQNVEGLKEELEEKLQTAFEAVDDARGNLIKIARNAAGTKESSVMSVL